MRKLPLVIVAVCSLVAIAKYADAELLSNAATTNGMSTNGMSTNGMSTNALTTTGVQVDGIILARR